jgi:hypothetical protein
MQFSLATDQTIEAYRQSKYRYLMVSNYIYNGYLYEPGRYPSEAAFYKQLFAEGKLLQEFAGSATQGGPTIRLYELEPSGN